MISHDYTVFQINKDNIIQNFIFTLKWTLKFWPIALDAAEQIKKVNFNLRCWDQIKKNEAWAYTW